jgi:glyoxylase-like metal-dependent hydrolase (beta-lactamase superfamily II)
MSTHADFIEIAPGVRVTTAAKYMTNTTVVMRDRHAVLVDPAWTEFDLNNIAAWLSSSGLSVTAGLSTHGHYDHVLWHPEFGDAPRWGSPRAVAMAERDRADILVSLDGDIPADWPHPVDGLHALDASMVPDPFLDGVEEAIEFVVHDGHAPGHTAMWMPERGVMCAGDMLSDIELPFPFFPDDLPAYLEGLDVLAPVVSKASVLVPGHGHVTFTPMDRLDADRFYLDRLLRGENPDDPRRAYPDSAEAHEKMLRMAQELRERA